MSCPGPPQQLWRRLVPSIRWHCYIALFSRASSRVRKNLDTPRLEPFIGFLPFATRITVIVFFEFLWRQEQLAPHRHGGPGGNTLIQGYLAVRVFNRPGQSLRQP